MNPKPNIDPLSIEGWMSPEELLWLTAAAEKHKRIVEIGCWKGRSTAALLASCPGMVTAVDHFQGSPSERDTAHKEARDGGDIQAQFMANVGAAPNLEVLHMDSGKASELFEAATVDMVFIDGDHDKAAVLHDIRSWLPKCKTLICGHDSHLASVQDALLEAGLQWLHGSGSIWYCYPHAKWQAEDGIIVQPKGRTPRKGIVCAIVSGRTLCPVEMVPALAMQSWPSNTNLAIMTFYGMDTDAGRNRAVLEARNVGAKYLWFVDDDTVPPNDSGRHLVYLLEQNGPPHGKVMVAGGIYTTRSVPPEPIVYMGQGQGSYWDWKVGETFKCWGLGTGCMMINMDVFENIQEPWFLTTDTAHKKETDDLYFCQKVQDAGFEVMAHGGILCHHYNMETGAVYMLPRSSRPFVNRSADYREPQI